MESWEGVGSERRESAEKEVRESEEKGAREGYFWGTSRTVRRTTPEHDFTNHILVDHIINIINIIFCPL